MSDAPPDQGPGTFTNHSAAERKVLECIAPLLPRLAAWDVWAGARGEHVVVTVVGHGCWLGMQILAVAEERAPALRIEGRHGYHGVSRSLGALVQRGTDARPSPSDARPNPHRSLPRSMRPKRHR